MCFRWPNGVDAAVKKAKVINILAPKSKIEKHMKVSATADGATFPDLLHAKRAEIPSMRAIEGAVEPNTKKGEV